MTLPELLVSISVMSIIAVSIAFAMTAVLRTTPATEGRLNVARAEQDLAFWLPPDLASAEYVVTDPALDPCGANCPANITVGGSNALLLAWTSKAEVAGVAVDVNSVVSYRYENIDGEFVLTRIHCETVGSQPITCTSNIVLHDLTPPPDGRFLPGETIPRWVIQVTEPLAADATDTSSSALPDGVKDAKRVVVTINGGGRADGAGGGVNQISITAGGTNRGQIEARSIEGAPSFTEARSRCGGPTTLIVDESNSISNSEMAQVRQSVIDFIDTLDGTPTTLQVVRFGTTASALGSSEWHAYFDMTDPAQVSALRNAASGLTRNGGTNWEDAVFRTFYEADGTTASIIPNTVVFFTDGVPTYNRLVKRDPAGTLPAVPAPLPDPWPEATGSEYNQESFNRADHIAGLFRSSTRMVGVGVGAEIANHHTWLQQPDQGYHWQTQRGYHQYQRGYHMTGYWFWTKKSYSSPYNEWEWVDKATYDAYNTNGSSSDGYRDQGRQYSSPYLDYENVSSGSGNGYRTVKVYAPPYTQFDSLLTQSVTGRTVLARLIAGNDYGVEALAGPDGQYTNAEEADMFTVPDWNKMPAALKAIALGECGGTVTLSSKLDGGGAVNDPITYQNVRVLDAGGSELEIEPSVVTTSQRFTTGTFDFEIASGQYVEVEIQPQNLADLTGYQPVGWECRSGGSTVPASQMQQVAIPDSSFTGIRLQVRSNQATSCTMTVRAL